MGSFPRTAASPAVINPNHVQISRLLFFFFSCTNRLFPIIFTVANLVGLGARPGEAESLVGPELAEDAVAGGAEGDGQDEADGEQLDGNLLEGTEALGDGVGWRETVLVVIRLLFPSGWRERTGVLLLLRCC
jgi:hypothetical protein